MGRPVARWRCLVFYGGPLGGLAWGRGHLGGRHGPLDWRPRCLKGAGSKQPQPHHFGRYQCHFLGHPEVAPELPQRKVLAGYLLELLADQCRSKGGRRCRSCNHPEPQGSQVQNDACVWASCLR